MSPPDTSWRCESSQGWAWLTPACWSSSAAGRTAPSREARDQRSRERTRQDHAPGVRSCGSAPRRSVPPPWVLDRRACVELAGRDASVDDRRLIHTAARGASAGPRGTARRDARGGGEDVRARLRSTGRSDGRQARDRTAVRDATRKHYDARSTGQAGLARLGAGSFKGAADAPGSSGDVPDQGQPWRCASRK